MFTEGGFQTDKHSWVPILKRLSAHMTRLLMLMSSEHTLNAVFCAVTGEFVRCDPWRSSDLIWCYLTDNTNMPSGYITLIKNNCARAAAAFPMIASFVSHLIGIDIDMYEAVGCGLSLQL